MKKMKPFKINFLDHVAIRVKDMEQSIQWYQKVLGLTKVRLEKWGDVPIFMMSGKVGVALFPAYEDHPHLDPDSLNVQIDHFAFNVLQADFDKARKHFESLNIDYIFKDHYYFHSVYLKDPDGHEVELTTIQVEDDLVYKK